MKRKWKIILSVLLAAAVLGGVLTLCLWEPEPQGDTDPNAPFVDLPARTKKEVLEAVAEYWAPHGVYLPVFWYGEKDPARDPVLMEDIHRYGGDIMELLADTTSCLLQNERTRVVAHTQRASEDIVFTIMAFLHFLPVKMVLLYLYMNSINAGSCPRNKLEKFISAMNFITKKSILERNE